MLIHNKGKYMKTVQRPRVVIAGTNSGVGKTTIVAGLLAAYRQNGRVVQSFKVGPDYIDPGFHKMAAGRDSYNLDTWLVPPDKMIPFFESVTDSVDISIIEGVMGLYDGGREGVSSTAEIAKRLAAPVVLVIDCKAMGESAAAIAKGFRDYDRNVNFAGVILNRLGSENHEKMIRQGMEKVGIPIIGSIYRDNRMQSPERHLGLTPVTEFDPTEAIATIRDAVTSMVELDTLYRIAHSAPPLVSEPIIPTTTTEKVARIGVAYDEAFSFYYPASLAALEATGAELVYFSPLKDAHLPEVDGLIFGGGFPEMFLGQLEANRSMKTDIKNKALEGMPIYAECGGLMYLCQSITDFENHTLEMVGVVPARTVMETSLQKVGYVTATALKDSVIAHKNESLRGHEFHFSTMIPEVDDFPWAFQLVGGRKVQEYKGGYANGNVLATYLHINFAGCDIARNHFVHACVTYKHSK